MHILTTFAAVGVLAASLATPANAQRVGATASQMCAVQGIEADRNTMTITCRPGGAKSPLTKFMLRYPSTQENYPLVFELALHARQTNTPLRIIYITQTYTGTAECQAPECRIMVGAAIN